MKIIKKLLIGIGALLILLIAAAIIVPIMFKDDIKAAIDKEIANNVRAEVYFNPQKFGLSIFKNFPNITLTLEEFGVVGVEEKKRAH